MMCARPNLPDDHKGTPAGEGDPAWLSVKRRSDPRETQRILTKKLAIEFFGPLDHATVKMPQLTIVDKSKTGRRKV
jgi:hypothetical protein